MVSEFQKTIFMQIKGISEKHSKMKDVDVSTININMLCDLQKTTFYVDQRNVRKTFEN